MKKTYVCYGALLSFFVQIVNADQSTQKSISSYRADVASTQLTLYQSGGAHVLESRQVAVSKNTSQVFFANLLGQHDDNFMIYGDDVMFTSIPNHADNNSFLQKYEGKEIKFVELNDAKRGVLKDGILVKQLDKDQYIIKFGNHIEVAPPGYLVLADEGEINNDKPSVGIKPGRIKDDVSRKFELSYNIANINWKPQYQIDLSENFDEHKKIALSGYIVVNNNNAVDIKNCDISLISGSGPVVRAAPTNYVYKMAVSSERSFAVQATMADSEAINAQSYYDKWMFELPFKYTIESNASTKITFFDKVLVPATKEYVIESYVGYYKIGGESGYVHPNVLLNFSNQAKINGVGIGLPEGVVSVYDGKTKMFLAQSSIQNSPFDSKLKINLNPAFDVLVKRQQTDYETTSDKKGLTKTAFSIELENKSTTVKTIKLIERFEGSFQIKTSNKKFTIENGQAIWMIAIEPNSKVELTYSATLQNPS